MGPQPKKPQTVLLLICQPNRPLYHHRYLIQWRFVQRSISSHLHSFPVTNISLHSLLTHPFRSFFFPEQNTPLSTTNEKLLLPLGGDHGVVLNLCLLQRAPMGGKERKRQWRNWAWRSISQTEFFSFQFVGGSH